MVRLAADEVIIPVQAAYLPVKGLQQLIKTINMVKRRLNKKIQVGGILLAMVDYRTNYAKKVLVVTNGRQALRLVPMERNARYVPVRE